MHRSVPLALLLVLSVACAPGRGDLDPARDPVTSLWLPADTLPALQALGALEAPVTWTGTADGSLTETITLFADGTLRRRTVGGSAPGDSAVGHGRWELTRGAARLAIHDGREAPQRFALQDTVTWRLLDPSGAERQGAPVLWRRAARVDSIAEPSTLVGAFVYYADAAILTECVSGRQYPVQMSGAYRELERMYGETVSAGGAPAVVRLRARLAEAPVGEGDGRALAVIVEGVERVESAAACGALDLRRAVDSVTWRLTELEGVTLDSVAVEQAPTMLLQLAESRIAGSDGCNRYTGRGVLRGVELVPAGPLAGTRMMCADPKVMDRAGRFTAALSAGGWFRLNGSTLVLSRGAIVVARFVAAQR